MPAVVTEESQEVSICKSVLHHAPPDLEERAQGRPGPDLLKTKGSQVELFIARGRYMAHVSCVYFIKQYGENQREHGGSEAGRVGVEQKKGQR